MRREAAQHGDILFLEADEQWGNNNPAKLKAFLTAIPSLFDADIYIKVRSHEPF
jgi:hypothetical protein